MTRFAIPLLLLAACSRTPEPASAPAADTPVAIGVGVLRTHPAFQEVADGVQLAVDRLNEGSGRRFAARLPSAGVAGEARLAELLRDDADIIGVVGGVDNATVQTTLAVYADTAGGGARALPLVSPTAAASRLSGISPWFFRVSPNDKDVARFAARWVHDSLPARRAVVVYRNDPVGRDWSTTFTEAFARSGGAVILRRPYLSGITEWEAYARLMAKLAPDVILFAGDGADLVAMQAALRTIAVAIPLIGSTDAASAEGRPEAAGLRYLAVDATTASASTESRTFAARFRARFRRAPTLTAALAYDAALVVGRNVQRGGNTRALLRNALETTGNGAPSVQGAMGLIAFRYNHDVRGRTVSVATVRAGAEGG